MGLGSRLKKRALGLSSKAVERFMSDDRRAQRLVEALGAVQRGKKLVDQGQAVLLHQLSFATRSDFKSLGKQLGSLRRRVQALETKLDRLG